MDDPSVTVRPATTDDAAGIACVHVDTWRTAYQGIVPDSHLASLSYDRRADRWRTALSSPRDNEWTFVGIAEDGHVVGFASGGRERGGDGAYEGELYAIYVLQEHQRSGLGRRLTAAVVERLMAAGFSSMLVWALERNPWRRFYVYLGGQPVGSKAIEISCITLSEVAYGWRDLPELYRRCLGADR